MGKKDLRFCEECRVVLAQELDIPPDDIDIEPFLNTIKRSIIKNYSDKNSKDLILKPETKKERKEFFGKYSEFIINKIINRENPFGNWIDVIQEDCIRDFVRKRKKKN